MGHPIPCGLDDRRLWIPPEHPADIHARQIEDKTDALVADCMTFAGSDRINQEHDLYDGDLLPQLMVAIANWTGSYESAAKQMRKPAQPAGRRHAEGRREMSIVDDSLRTAYERTAMHRLGIPFERAVAIKEVRRALESSAARSTPQAAQPAQASGR